MSTRTILEGSNEYDVLSELYDALAEPMNQSQEQFVRAWELSEFLASDGFEWAFEQDYSGEELASMFAVVGFDEGAVFLRRAYSMVPTALLEPNHPDLFGYVRSRFEPFKQLLHDYLAVADSQLLPAFGNFVRENRGDFDGVLD